MATYRSKKKENRYEFGDEGRISKTTDKYAGKKFKIPVEEQTTSNLEGREKTIFPKGFRDVGRDEFNAYSSRFFEPGKYTEAELNYFNTYGTLPLSAISKSYKGGLDEAGLKRIQASQEQTPETILMRGDISENKNLQLQQRQKELLPVAEEAGVFESRPEKTELDLTPAEKASLEKRSTGRDPTLYGDNYETAKKTLGISDEDVLIEDLIQNPETVRQIMLNEIQRKELSKSLTVSQKLGALVEPFVGDLKVFDVDVGGYVSKIVRMPKEEAYQIVEQIKEIESTASGMSDAAAQGEIGNPAEVLRAIATQEEQIYILEARIKRLMLESLELQTNPEQVNIIEAEIFNAKNTLFEAKQRAAEGALITPTDSQLYYKLKSIKLQQ